MSFWRMGILLFVGGLQPLALAEQCYTTTAEVRGDPTIGDAELLGRLVLAESLSTRARDIPECQPFWKEIATAIAWGVRARALSGNHGKNLRAVIFQPHQFRPAISPRSQYAPLFLCPTKSPYWAEIRDIATRVLGADPGQSPFLQDSRATDVEKRTRVSRVNQFYYPYSLQATDQAPLWTRNPRTRVTELKVDGREIPNACIWFFRN